MNKERYLACNPLVLDIYTGINSTGHYRIYTGNDLLFDSMAFSFSGIAQVDISSLFSENMTAGSWNCRMVTVIDNVEYAGNPDSTKRHDFIVYGGAISWILKQLLIDGNTDIFSWKLKNSETNFFLSTRTNDYTLYVPENELEPLYYYAKGLKFDIKADDEIIASIDHTADADESLQSIDFSALRQQMVVAKNKFINSFTITTASGLSCSVLITSAEQATDFYLKFKNSYGVYERLAIHGVISYTPALNDSEKFKEFDPVIDDMIDRQQRKQISHIYTAELGYRTQNERLFTLDLLRNDSVVFAANGIEMGCNVSADNLVLASTEAQPRTMQIKIELQDIDPFYSPILGDEDYNILSTNNNDVTTREGAQIFV